MQAGADGMGEYEFFGHGVVCVVLDEEFFEKSVVFFEDVFLFVVEGSFVDVE